MIDRSLAQSPDRIGSVRFGWFAALKSAGSLRRQLVASASQVALSRSPGPPIRGGQRGTLRGQEKIGRVDKGNNIALELAKLLSSCLFKMEEEEETLCNQREEPRKLLAKVAELEPTKSL